MGTRADFYVGRGPEADWLGSIAWDGYPDGIPEPIMDATSEGEYRRLVAEFIAERKDGTTPDEGWPWPWDDSGLTDFAYSFYGGKVYYSDCDKWCLMADGPLDDEEDDRPTYGTCVFPDMSDRKNVKLGGEGSGIILIG